jgi:recombination protein U
MYNAKSAAASLRGRQNRAEGEAFEQLIIRSCEYYRDKGIAFIEKTPEPFKVTRSLGNGRFEGHFAKQAQPDFKGTVLMRGSCSTKALSIWDLKPIGRSIVFDAKATNTDKIPIAALSDEQRGALITHKALGAIAEVYMSFSFKRFYRLPIDVFLKAKEYNGHLYWTADEIERIYNPIEFKSGILRLFTE